MTDGMIFERVSTNTYNNLNEPASYSAKQSKMNLLRNFTSGDEYVLRNSTLCKIFFFFDLSILTSL